MDTSLLIALVLIGLLVLGSGFLMIFLVRERRVSRRQLREAIETSSTGKGE